jgi:hypothetical protein
MEALNIKSCFLTRAYLTLTGTAQSSRNGKQAAKETSGRDRGADEMSHGTWRPTAPDLGTTGTSTHGNARGESAGHGPIIGSIRACQMPCGRQNRTSLNLRSARECPDPSQGPRDANNVSVRGAWRDEYEYRCYRDGRIGSPRPLVPFSHLPKHLEQNGERREGLLTAGYSSVLQWCS